MHAQGGQQMSGQKRECESLGCRHFLDAACTPLWLPHLNWAAGAAGWLQLAQMQVPRRPLVQGARCLRASHSSVGGGKVGGHKSNGFGCALRRRAIWSMLFGGVCFALLSNDASGGAGME